jgi:hypothetical protein
MNPRPFAWLALAATLALNLRAAQAVTVLDQSFDPAVPNIFSGVGVEVDKAQTFTVGLAGTLVRVDVNISRSVPPPPFPPPDDLILDIRPTTAGVPIEDNTATLAQLVVPALTIPTVQDFVSFDLSAFGLAVTAGDVLALALRAPGSSPSGYAWVGASPGGYAGGGEFFRNAGLPLLPVLVWTPALNVSGVEDDLAFRTFVEVPAGVPAPGSFALLAIGGVALALLLVLAPTNLSTPDHKFVPGLAGRQFPPTRNFARSF